MSNPNQFFPQQGGYQAPGSSFYPPPPKKSGGGSSLLIILGVIGMGVAFLFVACCGGLAYLGRPPVASAAAKQPFNYADVPLPAFPDRDETEELEPGVQQFMMT